MGSGKTTVAHLLRRRGVAVLDADKIAHTFLAPQTACFRRLIKYFGATILKQGCIDRRALAEIVFNDPQSLRTLSSIIHPEVIKDIKRQIRIYRRPKAKILVVIDAPLLFEAGLHTLCDGVVVVCATKNKQIKRIQKRSGLTPREILKRIKAQMPITEKIARADFVIDNQGPINQTKKQVEELWQRLVTTKK